MRGSPDIQSCDMRRSHDRLHARAVRRRLRRSGHPARHRGLLFDSKTACTRGARAGYHSIGMSERIDDFDVTYSQKSEAVHTSRPRAPVDLRVSVIYRPIIAELYQLDTEIAPTTTKRLSVRVSGRGPRVHREAFVRRLAEARHLAQCRGRGGAAQRVAAKHVEIATVTFTSVVIAPELVLAVRDREIAEQAARKKKAELDAEEAEEKRKADASWQKQKLEAMHRAELRAIEQVAVVQV